ncbi:single-stranded DNA-binding protein 3a isoform X5 [Trichomycterus rosablanca]
MPPGDGMPGGPMPPGFFQGPTGSQPSPHAQAPPNANMMGAHGQPFMSPRYAGGPRPPIRMGNQPPGGQPLPPNVMDPTRPPGHPNLGPMQRMNIPRGMAPMGPGPQSDPWLSLQNYSGGMRPPNSMGPNMPGVNVGPGGGRPWPNPNNTNTIAYSSSSPGAYAGPPGGAGGGCPPGTPIMPSPADSTNSGENLYTIINSIPPGGARSSFPLGPDGPMGGLEPHHMNGSLGSGDIDGLSKNSPNNLSSLSNPPGTPRDDSDLGGNFLHSFQNETYSPTMTMSV